MSGLLLPAGVVAAIASRDLSHNFLAGFFLMMVQPFRQAGLPGGGACRKVALSLCQFMLSVLQLLVRASVDVQFALNAQGGQGVERL